MKIDYKKIKAQAGFMGISPHLLMKRMLNYRNAKRCQGACLVCINLKYLGDTDSKQKKCCFIIGESLSPYALIEDHKVCNEYQSLYRSKR